MAGRASGVKMGDDRGGSLISPDGVAPTWMVRMSASVSSLHHKVRKKLAFYGTGSPGYS